MNGSLCHGKRERNVLFNDALNTFYLRLYGVRHNIMVKDHSDSEKGNPLQRPLLHQLWSSGLEQEIALSRKVSFRYVIKYFRQGACKKCQKHTAHTRAYARTHIRTYYIIHTYIITLWECWRSGGWGWGWGVHWRFKR